MIFNLLKTKKGISIFSAFVLIFFLSKTVFAVWNNTFYDPGDTLSPECLPTDTDCDVRSPLISTNISDTAYDATSWDSVTTIAPSKNAIRDKIETLATVSHNAVTIGTGNGLSLATQALSLALASASATGALSNTDWDIFNNKEVPLTFGNGLTRTVNIVANNLITGLAGSQTVIGGTAASETLTLQSTSHATKGKILFGTSAYDEVNNRLGIGTDSPDEALEVNGNIKLSSASNAIKVTSTADYSLFLERNVTYGGAQLTAKNDTTGKNFSIFRQDNVAGFVWVKADGGGNAILAANSFSSNNLLAPGSGVMTITGGGTGGLVLNTYAGLGINILANSNVGIGIAAPTSRIHGVTTLSAATGDEIAYQLNYTTNKATSGNDTGLLINMTDTASPGTSLLLDLQVGGSSYWRFSQADFSLFMPSGGRISPANAAQTLFIGHASGSATARTLLTLDPQMNSLSGTNVALAVTPYYNQASGTAANTDLLINRTQTAVGSGAQLLIDAQVGGVSKFSVSNAGVINQVGCTTAGALYADASGNIICNPSREMFKNDIADLNSGLSVLLALRPVSYTFKSEMNMGDKIHFGFISEEVASIAPEFSTFDAEGKPYGLDLNAILSTTIKAIQEMNLNLDSITGTITPVALSASETFMTAFFNNIKTTISTWLADATNGIANIFVQTITVKNANVDNLCVSDANGKTCITRSQLDALLANSINSTSTTTPTPEIPNPSTDSEPLTPPASAPDPTSEPTPTPVPVIVPGQTPELTPTSDPIP